MAIRNRNRRRRRGRFGFLYKLLTVLAICAVIIVALTLFFKVDTIQISGEQRYTEEQVLDASGVTVGDNLFLLNKYAVANNLLEKLPYIEEVRINRQLPDTMVIEVAETNAVLMVVQEETAWTISYGGKVVDSGKAAEAPSLPVISGCELLAPSVGSQIALSTERQNQQASLLALLGALRDGGMEEQVNGIHLDSTSELTMDYGGRFTVRMLYGADYAYKLRNLQAVLDQLESNETGIIDLTKDGEAHVLPGSAPDDADVSGAIVAPAAPTVDGSGAASSGEAASSASSSGAASSTPAEAGPGDGEAAGETGAAAPEVTPTEPTVG